MREKDVLAHPTASGEMRSGQRTRIEMGKEFPAHSTSLCFVFPCFVSRFLCVVLYCDVLHCVVLLCFVMFVLCCVVCS